jgi:hypothetical protein
MIVSSSPLALPADVRLRLVLAVAGRDDLAVLEVPTSVRAVETGSTLVVTVAPPELFELLGQPAVADREHTLVWTNDDGLLELPVLLMRSDDEWRLTGNGPLRHLSHRQFDRVRRHVPVTLACCSEAPGPEVGEPELDGTTLDVSPGGALCTVAGGLPQLGSAVVITFHLPDANLAGTGVVVRHSALPDGSGAVAVRFDEPELVENTLLHLDIAQFLDGQD